MPSAETEEDREAECRDPLGAAQTAPPLLHFPPVSRHVTVYLGRCGNGVCTSSPPREAGPGRVALCHVGVSPAGGRPCVRGWGPRTLPSTVRAGRKHGIPGLSLPRCSGDTEAAHPVAPASTSQTLRPPRSGSGSHHSETVLMRWPRISKVQTKTQLLVLDDGISEQTVARPSIGGTLAPGLSAGPGRPALGQRRRLPQLRTSLRSQIFPPTTHVGHLYPSARASQHIPHGGRADHAHSSLTVLEAGCPDPAVGRAVPPEAPLLGRRHPAPCAVLTSWAASRSADHSPCAAERTPVEGVG